MVLVRETSRGLLALSFFRSGKRFGWGVRIYDVGEDGWSSELGDGWSSYRGKMGAFPDFVEEVTGLSGEEAGRLAGEAEAEWRERGGDRGEPVRLRELAVPAAELSLVILLVAGPIVLLVWLISKVL